VVGKGRAESRGAEHVLTEVSGEDDSFRTQETPICVVVKSDGLTRIGDSHLDYIETICSCEEHTKSNGTCATTTGLLANGVIGLLTTDRDSR